MSAARDLDAVFRDQIDQIVRAVCAAHSDPKRGPVVVELRYALDRDWSGEDAIHFTGILRDPEGRDFYEISETNPIREQVYELLWESRPGRQRDVDARSAAIHDAAEREDDRKAREAESHTQLQSTRLRNAAAKLA